MYLRKKNSLWIIWSILLLGLILRIYFLQTFSLLETAEEDAISRLWIAMNWVERLTIFNIPSMGWFPGHPYLLSIPLLLGFPEIISTQILTLLLGVGAIYIYYKWIETCLDERTALVSAFLLSITPIYVQFSTITMAEIPTLFFSLLSFYFLEEYLKNQHKLGLLLTHSLFISIAAGMRLEAWPLALFVAPLVLFFSTKSWKKTLSVILLNSSWPLLYIGLSWKMFRIWHPYLQLIKDGMQSFKADPIVITELFKSLYISYSVLPLLILLGLIPALRKMKGNGYLLGVGLMTLYTVFQLFNGQILAFPRYFFVYLPFLLPFAVTHFLKLKMPRLTMALICSAALASLVFCIPNLSSRNINHAVRTSGFFEMSKWVREKLNAHDKIYYDGGFWAHATFNIMANRNYGNTAFNNIDPGKISKIERPQKVLTDLQSFLKHESGYIIYNTKPVVEQISSLTKEDVLKKIKTKYLIENESKIGNFVILRIAPKLF